MSSDEPSSDRSISALGTGSITQLLIFSNTHKQTTTHAAVPQHSFNAVQIALLSIWNLGGHVQLKLSQDTFLRLKP
eukprot:CAMPEP_0184749558 /NCGR_PEP_ID=MMETSP0315-20130426/28998_1 /TAXON_ID=101924 /ORGANISM="Rhodosorus marinus, Strain UTEX LB 2760" /LENGTH=75 /DNA_ID=CAMNT_0027226675 /DNA_START=51 /DNA_END=274 /DNA_ORIENTATION=-